LRQKDVAEKAQQRADAEAKEAFRQKGEAEKAQKRAEQGEATARSEEEKAKFVAYAFRLREAQAEVKAGRLDQAQAVLRGCDPKLRRWEHDYLLRQTGPRLDLQGHTESVMSVCFSPDGKQIASASENSLVKVWDARIPVQSVSGKPN
jgi:hypothetical protein